MWIWLLVGITAIVVTSFIEFEIFTGATLSLIVGGSLIFYFSDDSFAGLWSYLSHNPLVILEVFASYLIIGMAWSIIKWYFFLLKMRDGMRKYRVKHSIAGELSKSQLISFYYEMGVRDNDNGRLEMPPVARQNRKRIIMWMIYWPFSIPWTVINEPIKRIFTMLYNFVVSLLQSMSDRMFQNERK